MIRTSASANELRFRVASVIFWSAARASATDQRDEFGSEDQLYVLAWITLWRISPDGTVAAPPPTGRPGSVLSHHGAHPSLSAASVRYQLSGDSPAELSIVDVRGRRVRVLEGGIVGPGNFVARWDGNDDSGRRVPSGVYYYRLVEGGRAQSLSVVRIR